MNKTKELLDHIATEIMMASLSDMESVKSLAPLFQEIISGDISDDSQNMIQECIDITTGLTNGHSLDPNSDFQRLIETFTLIQKSALLSKSPNACLSELATTESTSQSQKLILSEWVDEELLKEFLSTIPSTLEEIELNILSLENPEENSLDSLKRTLHTLKGESGVLELEDLTKVCHGVEDLFESIEENHGLVDILLEIKDWMYEACLAYSKLELPHTSSEIILEHLRKFLVESVCYAPAEEFQKRVERDDDTVMLFGEFLSESEEGLSSADQILMDIETSGSSPESVNALFRIFHTIKGVAGFLEIEQVIALAHMTETMLNDAREEKIELSGVILDLVFDSTEAMRLLMNNIKKAVEKEVNIENVEIGTLLLKIKSVIDGKIPITEPLPPSMPDEKLGEILVKSGSTNQQVINIALDNQKKSGQKLGQELTRSKQVAPKKVAQALRTQKTSSSGKKRESNKIKETIKIDLERVDNLVEMIGELVIIESMLVNSAEFHELRSSQINKSLSLLTKTSRDLQTVGMRMRMVPVRSVFQKMARMVRDLSRKSHKKIKLAQSGEGTEMDRSMVEQIHDPLVHMIRNAVDHGVEIPEKRIQSGKPETGTIHLSAYHEGGSIVIEIGDDGNGLNREAILEKAKKQGLLQDGDSLSDNEVFNLIFAPGFSTATEVTEISGRGVGMDVVLRNIKDMRGRVVISSIPGEGTNFKIILPLTLAIIDGMLVTCGSERYIIPTLSIVESIQPDKSMLFSLVNKMELVRLRGETIPILRLDQLFDIKGAQSDPTKGLIVVVESLGKKIGLLADDVLSQQQVVIKSINSVMVDVKCVSGAAILSDGKVGLILNIDGIHSLVDQELEELGA